MTRIGTAGWALPAARHPFQGDGSHLARYARVFTAQNLMRARREERTAWCIFDNTMLGAALENGLRLKARIAGMSH